jgi:DNA invertase Pin-like site-specific DNA recombinase
MDKPGKKLLRCAIYTRKSTDHNLDLEFNSLDAQREACEAYIKSQAHEGWRLIHDRYDDGAFSGASLDRPALQQLLTEVRAGKIDIIVVYKVDRLTRSLGDFAKLVELFDQHSVSFVSVTQSFNTTSSMGRLTLNVLLSFAQFEREVIGERVRDKIAASKAKGIWVGGSVPLGYASVNKKLVVVPKEAETVRLIFRRYLELGSIRDLVEDLDHKGIRTRRQVLSTGKIRGSIRFGVGPLAHLLRNRFYIGEIVYRGAVHPGEQEHILDRALFDAVQAKLDASASARHLKLRASPSILSGRIFDDGGNRMTPTHTNKQGARYRYYVSHAILQKRGGEAGSVVRISAPDIETAVVQAVRNHLDKRKSGDRPNPTTDRELIERHVERIIVKPQMIEVHLVSEAGHGPAEHDQAIVAQHLSETAASVAITVPWTTTAIAAAKGILHSPLPSPAMSVDERDVILTAIAKARAWIADLIEGRATSFAEISQREGKVERHIRLLAPLAFVSPRIIADIIDGILPSIAITDLAKQLPYCWARQEIGSQLDLRSAG